MFLPLIEIYEFWDCNIEMAVLFSTKRGALAAPYLESGSKYNKNYKRKNVDNFICYNFDSITNDIKIIEIEILAKN